MELQSVVQLPLPCSAKETLQSAGECILFQAKIQLRSLCQSSPLQLGSYLIIPEHHQGRFSSPCGNLCRSGAHPLAAEFLTVMLFCHSLLSRYWCAPCQSNSASYGAIVPCHSLFFKQRHRKRTELQAISDQCSGLSGRTWRAPRVRYANFLHRTSRPWNKFYHMATGYSSIYHQFGEVLHMKPCRW